MNKELEKMLRNARRTVDRLNGSTDRLNASLEAAEVAIRALKLGVSTSVRLDETNTLHFRKLDDVWRLVTFNEREGPKPLSNASRALRLIAAKELPNLVAALMVAIEVEEANVVDATRAVDSFLADLKAASAVETP